MCRFLLEPHLLLFSFFLNLVDLLVQATSLIVLVLVLVQKLL